MWDLRTGAEVRQFETPKQDTRKIPTDRCVMEFSPDGWNLLVCHLEKKLTTVLWDVEDQKEIHAWPGQALFLPDGTILALQGASAAQFTIEDRSVQETRKLPINTTGMHGIMVSRDGKRLAGVVTKEGGVRVLTVETGETVWAWRPPHFSARSVHLSPDGRYLLTGNTNGTVYVFRLPG